ncbi:hypothetical protein [Salisediminibacterium halotolerans]|uniref:Uncharacterized protein n=1 Tax=Salisediminibacterium halotolerans TaxID=517425 RepID=A0A1H9PBM3_9BACI|nr:hypothetical protein [Salisediminibacterium haloalkalitolerans]SER45581.1 hypothetical protein SAMN05444126_101151 [Salisediminibacterium haloalkalitolerans]
MIVKDLVETKELLAEETNEGIFVVYERFENTDCRYKGNMVEKLECDPEEQIQILQCDSTACDSLTSVQTYRLGVDFLTIEEIEKDIRSNYAQYMQQPAPLG